MVQHRILTGSGTLTIPAGVTSFTATGNGYVQTNYAPTGKILASATGVTVLSEARFVISPVAEVRLAKYPNDGISMAMPQVTYTDHGEQASGYRRYASWPIPGYPPETFMGSPVYVHDDDTGAKFAVSMSYTVEQVVTGTTAYDTTILVPGQGQISFSAGGSSRVVSLPGAAATVINYTVPSGGYLKIEW